LQERLNINSNCANFKDLPNIEIIFDSRVSYNSTKSVENKIILRPEDYIIEGKKIKRNLEIKSSDKDREFYDLYPTSREECQPAFMPIDVPKPRGPIFVFGEYFLRKFYTVFDRDLSLLGFSEANHDHSMTYETKNNIVTPYDDMNDLKITNIIRNQGSKNEEKPNKFNNLPQNGAIKLPNNDSGFFKNLDEVRNAESIKLDESILDEFSLNHGSKNNNFIEP
jgi:hypothetical protein